MALRKYSRHDDLAYFLEKGEQYTASQIRKEFALANPTAAIAYLRKNGYSIYSNKRNGKTYYKYGKPRRAAVAQAYWLLGASMYK